MRLNTASIETNRLVVTGHCSFEILEAVAAATSKASVGWVDFASNPSANLEQLEQSVFERPGHRQPFGHRGAVVLDKRFAILRFGAEVSASSRARARLASARRRGSSAASMTSKTWAPDIARLIASSMITPTVWPS